MTNAILSLAIPAILVALAIPALRKLDAYTWGGRTPASWLLYLMGRALLMITGWGMTLMLAHSETTQVEIYTYLEDANMVRWHTWSRKAMLAVGGTGALIANVVMVVCACNAVAGQHPLNCLFVAGVASAVANTIVPALTLVILLIGGMAVANLGYPVISVAKTG